MHLRCHRLTHILGEKLATDPLATMDTTLVLFYGRGVLRDQRRCTGCYHRTSWSRFARVPSHRHRLIKSSNPRASSPKRCLYYTTAKRLQSRSTEVLRRIKALERFYWNLPQRGKTVALRKAEPHRKKEPTPSLRLSRVQPGYVCLDLHLYRGRSSGFRLSGRYYHAHRQRQARAASKRPLLKRRLSYKCDPEVQNITS
jgi:hypothetical protein